MITVQGGKGMETQNSVFYLLDTLQLTQEKEKLSGSVLIQWWFKKIS